MKIQKAYYDILTPITGNELKDIEYAARICYKSEDKMSDDSAESFVRTLIKNGHESMLEHSSLSVKFICDRGISHELVRHRIASFAQESTRYCNYGKDGEITFIDPCFFDEGSKAKCHWITAMGAAECSYFEVIRCGCSPQEARIVLPHSVKTEVIMTANYREWRHFFWLRAVGKAGKPHPQMLELTKPLLGELVELIPVVFDDIYTSMMSGLVAQKSFSLIETKNY